MPNFVMDLRLFCCFDNVILFIGIGRQCDDCSVVIYITDHSHVNTYISEYTHFQAESEKRIRMRLELQEVERQQLQVKEAKRLMEKEEDEKFRQEVRKFTDSSHRR